MSAPRPAPPAWRQRPDIRAETAVLATGQPVTIYRCPFPTEGPMDTLTPDGQPTLRFMYAHYVFDWPQASGTLAIRHGTLASSIPLWSAQPITGPWCPDTLAHFGRAWTHAHLRRFTDARDAPNGDHSC